MKILKKRGFWIMAKKPIMRPEVRRIFMQVNMK